VWWKGFIAENNTWKKKENLENTKKVVVKFKGRVNVEVRQQKKLDKIEKNDFKRGKLLRKYIVKMLYRWDNRKFENKYLKNLERNW